VSVRLVPTDLQWHDLPFPDVFAAALLPIHQITNLYDTRFGIECLYIAICIPFCLFVLRNYFSTISEEITEAHDSMASRPPISVYLYILHAHIAVGAGCSVPLPVYVEIWK